MATELSSITPMNFQLLPIDVIPVVLSSLTFFDLGQAAAVCIEWRRAAAKVFASALETREEIVEKHPHKIVKPPGYKVFRAEVAWHGDTFIVRSARTKPWHTEISYNDVDFWMCAQIQHRPGAQPLSFAMLNPDGTLPFRVISLAVLRVDFGVRTRVGGSPPSQWGVYRFTVCDPDGNSFYRGVHTSSVIFVMSKLRWVMDLIMPWLTGPLRRKITNLELPWIILYQ
jgi:hypothetical protein